MELRPIPRRFACPVAAVVLLAGITSPSGAAERAGESPIGKVNERLARLTAILNAGDVERRLEAVSELASVGGAQATAALAKAALFDDDSLVREEAILTLGETGIEIHLPLLEQALLDPQPRVREAAVEALAGLGGDGAARALAFVLGDEDASLRERAVLALGEIGGETAIGILQRALADEDDSVREAAEEVLNELPSPQPGGDRALRPRRGADPSDPTIPGSKLLSEP